MMNRITRSARAIAFALVLGAFAASSAVSQEAIVGDWEGTISSTPQGDIGMIFHVTAGEDGTLAGTLDVPVQAGFGMALEDVTFEDGVFSFGFSLAGPGTGYEGTINEDETELTGMWSQGGASIELIMTKSEG
ncbi:MAG: hypothetical protein ACC682_07465 [Gemmatimonadota bacterium]